MAFFEWTEDCIIGVRLLDDGHKKLFDIVNKLHNSILDGKADAVLNDSLDRLDSLAAEQFKTEIDLLEQAGYPDVRLHQAIHKAATEMFANIRRDQSRLDGRTLAMEVLSITKGMLLLHIQQEDRKCGKFLNSKGIY